MHVATKTTTTDTTADKSFRVNEAVLHRVLPFALFMAFVGMDELIRVALGRQWLTLPESALYYLYPIKTILVAGLLCAYMGRYRELRWKDLANGKATAAVVGTGISVFVIWVCLDWTFSLTGAPQGFNPSLLHEGWIRVVMTLFRVAGAVLVVPLMEELFWRSFLLRYLVDAEFQSIPLGRFTWSSFLITTVLFGLEHHLLLAGMAAGAIYNIVLYKTRSLAQCVLAHAVTNLALACYVLYTGKWYFW